MKKKLYLVGTAHLDPDGKTRLDNLINSINPDVIALEHNEEREPVISRKKSTDDYKDEIALFLAEQGIMMTPKQEDTLLKYIVKLDEIKGFELDSSKRYSLNNPFSRLMYVDMSLFEGDKVGFIRSYESALGSFSNEFLNNGSGLTELLSRLNGGMWKCMGKLRKDIDGIYKESAAIPEMMNLLRDPETIDYMKTIMPAEAVNALLKIYDPKRDEFMSIRIKEAYKEGNKILAIVGLGHVAGIQQRLHGQIGVDVINLYDF